MRSSIVVRWLIAFVLAASFLASPAWVLADGTGWMPPSLSVSGNFTTPNNAFTSNNQYASATNTQSEVYGTFNVPTIPAGATINGVQVSVEGYRSTGGGGSKTFDVSLSWNGGTSYTSTKNTGDMATTQDRIVYLGDAFDTWGRTWSPNDFTNANLRVRFYANAATGTLYLDCVQVRVYYTPTTPINSGWKLPTSNSSIPGSTAFINPTRAYSCSDGLYATATSSSYSHSYYNFGFGLPAGATINGIEVSVRGYRDSTSTRTFNVSLSWNGGTNWTSGASGLKNTGDLGATGSTVFLGGSSDTWGYASWSPTIINSNTNFRVRLDSTSGGNTIYLDCIQVRVYYTTPPALAVSIEGNNSFCPGTSENLTANAVGGVPPYSYLWSTGATTQSIVVTTPGTYSVTASDSSICTGKIFSDNNTMITQGNLPGSYPRNAVLAWVHPNWWSSTLGLSSPTLNPSGYTFDYYTDNVTRWIWEQYYVVHPVDGDRVFFERSFNVPATPTSATLHITCDNGCEAWVNGIFLGRGELQPCWATDNLTNTCVPSQGWQSVETYSPFLQQGTNILEIRAANEYSGPPETTDNGTVTSNPGAIIYDLVYEYHCTASDSIDITWNPTPTANFTAVPVSGPVPLSVQFTDTSTGSPTSWAWDFESNGSIDSYDPNPLYIYSSQGIYEVTLIVTNTYGCSDDEIKPNCINVSPPPTAPIVNSIEIYATQDCVEPHVTAMDPQTTYYAKVSIMTNGEQLNQLQTVEATLFYNSTGSDNMTALGSGDTQTCAILSRIVGGTISDWTIVAGSPTSWAIVPGSCYEPNLNMTSGDWIFAFKPGKVATENIGVADWDAQGKAIRNPTQTGDRYVRDKDMNWYGEITVNTPSVDWGEVPLGLTSDNTTYNPKTVSIQYIANGDYYENISSTDWTGDGETVILSTGDPPALPGMFALKANAINELSSAITVTYSSNCTNATGVLTTEDGVTVANNGLWLSLSETGIAPVTYNGTIYYQIANR